MAVPFPKSPPKMSGVGVLAHDFSKDKTWASRPCHVRPMADLPATSPLPSEQPSKPGVRTLDYGTPRAGFPGSEKLIDILKTLAWVAPLTILIWIYAEREQALSQPNVSISIEVRTTDGSRIITLKAPADRNVTATLSGPRTLVERIIHDLQSGSPDHAALQIYIDPGKLPRGESSLETARYIANNPLFKGQGISVKEISPPTLRVDIDDFETQSLEVKSPPNIQNVQEVRFIPSKVTVRAPGRVFKDADASKLYVVADFSKLGLLDQPGRHVVPGVPVSLAFRGESFNIDPQTVTASFEVKKPEAEMDLESIAIFTDAPLPIFNGYRLDFKPLTVPRIHVMGPQDQIDQLKNNEFKPRAILDIAPEDTDQAAGAVHKKRLHFILPKDVRVVSDPDGYTVDFTLTERAKE